MGYRRNTEITDHFSTGRLSRRAKRPVKPHSAPPAASDCAQARPENGRHAPAVQREPGCGIISAPGPADPVILRDPS
jgi:hypothetical protein